MATAKALAKSFGILVALYVCFRYLGDFSGRQSAVLAFLGWLGYRVYDYLNASRRSDKAFSPFCVSIRPNWYALLTDFKLLRSKEDWQRFTEAMDKMLPAEYSLFRSGILFTVVAPPSDNGTLPGLTYLDNHRSFVSDVQLSESITHTEGSPFIRGEHPFFSHPARAYLPEVYFRWGSGGYELGLEVQQDWWKHLCEAGDVGDLAETRTNIDHLCGTTRLVIATLPYSEFGIYYQEADYDRMKQREEKRDLQLKANGWERKDEKDSEIPDPWWRIQHKYFAVSHRTI